MQRFALPPFVVIAAAGFSTPMSFLQCSHVHRFLIVLSLYTCLRIYCAKRSMRTICYVGAVSTWESFDFGPTEPFLLFVWVPPHHLAPHRTLQLYCKIAPPAIHRMYVPLALFGRREVPQEPLMLVIRAFGGTVAWDGEGSPYDMNDDEITHQVSLSLSATCQLMCPYNDWLRLESHRDCGLLHRQKDIANCSM
eukprot:scaffold602588_cov28-Prasinocladus_malaysianus.AAC.1